MDMTILAHEVAAILVAQYGAQAPRIWVGLLTTETGWRVEVARGYDCALPCGTTPLAYDRARYRDPYDAFEAALRPVLDTLAQDALDRLPPDEDEEC